ncbi:MAG: CehA/McbA family metallohydrolase [Microthrixaceae bacterium]
MTSRLAAVAVATLVVVTTTSFGQGEDDPAACGPDGLTLSGSVAPGDAGTYELVPFEVPEGTTRVEVGYSWTPEEAGVLDLGLWDAGGTAGPDAFRFWSGSRQGRLDRDMDPVVVAPDRNERTVVVDDIDPGTWHVELGIAAAGAPIDWTVEIDCPTDEVGDLLAADRVDAGFVADDAPGWYSGDFHLHAYHSSPDGPDEAEMVALALQAGLDIVPVTEYVTPAHWDRLGQAQRDNPDVLLWPGREVITYDGHMVVLGETPDSVEYRLGYEGTTLGDIQRSAQEQGALVSLAHPTLFPPETFGDTCRGCFLEAIDQVDWEATDLIEVVTEGVLAEIGGSEVPNPFVDTAVELWEEQLRAGNRLTAVSGSDDKEGDLYGNTKTMVWAEELSRTAVDQSLRAGHAYVRGLGDRSPTIEVTASADRAGTADTGSSGSDSAESDSAATMGETLAAEAAQLTVTVEGGDGQMLALRQDGAEVERVPIDGNDFTQSFAIQRDPASGPLGTFFGIEVLDDTTFPGAELRTVIANPVFLSDTPAEPVLSRQPAGYFGEQAGRQGVDQGIQDGDPTTDDDETDDGSRTNGGTFAVMILVLVVIGLGIGSFVVGRRWFPTDPPDDTTPKV